MALVSRCLRRTLTLTLTSSFRYLSFSSISSSSSPTLQSPPSPFPSQNPRNNHHKTQLSSFSSSSSPDDPFSSPSSETQSPSSPSSSSTLTEEQAAIVSDFLTPQYKCTVPPPTAEDLKELFENGNLTPGLIAYFEEDPFEEKIKEPPPDLPPFFEGCDYNHWLITMGFPKDSNLTAEEKVETYVQTCAKVFGSVEEAKKRMYACSTTTYTGFQVEMTQETSEKFKNLPGVQFVLPDCYIDPVNKQYGGDQYINGKIIPRPLRKEGSTQEDGSNSKPQQNHAPPRKYVQNSNLPGDGRTFGAKPNYPQRGKFGASSIGLGDNKDSMPKGGRDFARGKRDNYQGERRDAVTVSRRDSVPAENKEVPGDGTSGEQAGR